MDSFSSRSLEPSLRSAVHSVQTRLTAHTCAPMSRKALERAPKRNLRNLISSPHRASARRATLSGMGQKKTKRDGRRSASAKDSSVGSSAEQPRKRRARRSEPEGPKGPKRRDSAGLSLDPEARARQVAGLRNATLLVSCSTCGRLHVSADLLASNPICPACTKREAAPTRPARARGGPTLS